VTALQLPGREQPACWQIRHRSDPAALRLADRHYSRGRRGAPWVGPPGRVLVLVTGDETALWVTHWPDPRLAHDGLDARPRVGPWREWYLDGWTAPPTRTAVVLDPFCGTGTTVMVARALGRIGVGVDLSEPYCRLARWRVFDSGHAAKALARTWAGRTTLTDQGVTDR
jgi:hypothetical protein